jgi:L-malate glycosyltransferase
MRILELCLSPEQGGLELYAGQTAAELTRRGHAVNLLVRKHGYLAGEFPAAIAFSNQRVGIINVFSQSRHLARWIDAEAVELVHIHDRRDLPLAALAKRRSRRRPPLLYSRHLHLTRSKRDLYHRLQYTQVDLMLASTRTMQADCQRYLPLPLSRIQSLPLGVAVNVGAEDIERARMTLNLPSGELNIGAFSRQEHDKGQHVLIKALAHLRREGVLATAVFVGHPHDAAYAQALKAQAQTLQLGTHVRFLPFVEKPMAFMACFDLIAHTALKETFGLVIVEAMAMGVPVIATDAGGVPELVQDGETGLLYTPGDAAALAQKIAWLYRNPAWRASLAEAGRLRAQQQFSRQVHYDRLEQIMRDLAGAEAPARA